MHSKRATVEEISLYVALEKCPNAELHVHQVKKHTKASLPRVLRWIHNKRRSCTAKFPFNGAQKRLIEPSTNKFYEETQYLQKNSSETLSEEFKQVALEN